MKFISTISELVALGDGNVITVIHLANNSPVWALSSHVWDSSIIWNKTLSAHQGKPFKTSSWQSIHSNPLGDAEKPKILLRLIALVLIVNVIKTTVRRPGRRRKYVYWKGNKFAKPLPEVSFQIEYTFWKCLWWSYTTVTWRWNNYDILHRWYIMTHYRTHLNYSSTNKKINIHR